jgi:HEAT repeat protein
MLRIAQGSTPHALLARVALARAGVREVLPFLTRDVQSRDDRLRKATGIALSDLGERLRAAPLLADPEPHVRSSIACAILAGP